MDTFVTIAIVAAAAAWAIHGVWRRAAAKPASCAGACAGCDRGREPRQAASFCPEGADGALPRSGATRGLPLPARFDERG